MKIHYKGDFEYWWDLQTWWATERDPKTGYQVKDAHTMYKKEDILKVIEEKQEKLNKLRLEAGNPNFSSEECEEYLALKRIEEKGSNVLIKKERNNMKLTENEINLLKEIYTEPETIEGHCFTLDWEVNFGKGVLGSLNKKGLVESEERTSLGGWEFTGNTNGLKNKAGAETNIMIGLTPEGLDKVETLY